MKQAASAVALVFRWFTLGIFIISNLFWGTSISNAAASGRRFLRIPAQALAPILQAGIRPIHLIDYGSYYWVELAETEFTRLPETISNEIEIVPQGGDVAIMGYRFDPLLEGEPVLPAGLRSDGTDAVSAESGFRLVQLVGPAMEAWLQQLDQSGARVLQYYPQHTYLIWATPEQTKRIDQLESVRWLGAVHPAYKLNADLENRTGIIQNVAVFFYNDGAVKETLSAIESLGGRLISTFPAQPDQAFFQAIFEIDAKALISLTQLPTVLWVGYAHPEPVLEDEMSAQISAGNYTAGVPVPGYQNWLNSVGLSGSGVIWSIIDTGVDYDHPDLSSHIAGGYNFPGACVYPGQPGSDCPSGGHGTHVTGIVAGNAAAGFADPSGYLYGLGIAPGTGIYAMNSLSGSAWPPTGGWQEHSRVALLGGAVGGNNSWTTGEGIAQGYQASERTHDLMVLDGNFDTTLVAEPFIEVFSAGNSGPNPSTLTAPKEAKNMIVIGSSLNYRAGSIDQISSFSSRGPAVDGRYAPTIIIPGEQIASTRNDDGGQCATAISDTDGLYAFCSGTSMASPHASGAVILLTEWWRNFNAGANPSPAMAKALLVNGAVDVGTPDIPNNNEGWGRVHLPNIIANSTAMLYFDQETILQNSGETWSLNLSAADPAKPLKITLAWSDAPGAVGANPALVNDLDLSVQVGGSIFYGNHFGSGWSTAGGAYDALNNLENVYLQNPSGDFVITVRATQIAGDGVLYNGDTSDQNFALVCYNCIQNPNFTISASPESQAVCSPQQVDYDITVGQVMNFDEAVTLSASSLPSAPFSTLFASNPVTPPGSSLLTIGNTSAVSPGRYDIILSGVSATHTHTATVALDVFDAAPLAPVPLTPLDNQTGVSLKPSFSWSAPIQAGSYGLEVAIDPGFSSLVLSANGLITTTYTAAGDLTSNMRYYWRVKSTNACGESAYSPVFSFITLTAPGDCPIGTIPQVYTTDNLDTGAAGWTHNGTGDSWALSSTRVHSGAYAYHAGNPAVASDQRLVSPPVNLPGGVSNLTLQYWNYQSIESRLNGGCWDGGLLEITTDDGLTWNQVQDTDLLTDPYDGTLASSTNPAYPASAWCGDPQDWLKSVVQLDAYAGQTVQFRYRLGTDTSIGREGWYIDDFVVQSCVPGQYEAVLNPISSTLSTLPGQPVTHTFTISNTGFGDVYHVLVDGGNWTTTLLTQTPLALGAGQTAQVQVLVEPPPVLFEQVLTGMDAFTLTVQSQYSSTLIMTSTGATRSEIHPGIALSPVESNVHGIPGDVITHTFTLTNSGDFSDAINLEISGNAWNSFVTSPVVLAAGDSQNIAVRVMIPSSLPEDTIIATDGLTLTAASAWDVKVTAEAKAITQASTDLAVSLGGDQSASALIGTSAWYSFTITNAGIYTDAYTLAASGVWTSDLSTAVTGPLSPGESITFTLEVHVPLDAAMNTSQQVIITATSGYSTGVFDQTNAVTTALWRPLYLPEIWQ